MIRNLVLRSLAALSLALGFLAALPANAQSSAPAATAVAGPAALGPVYDMTKEITVQGNILKIEAAASGSTLLGTHVQIQTPQGVVDTHLGSGALAASQALGIYPGLSITVTGMMATINGNSVLLARVLTTPNHVFILRNEHGIPARSLLPRGNSSSANATKGGL
jgi:hypothetical protein